MTDEITPYKHPMAKNQQFAPLHSYQRDIVDFAIERPKCGLFLPLGAGKALDDNSLIPTPTGYHYVKDIQVGDYLFGRDGWPTKVLAVYHHKNKEAYKVTLKNNQSFICCTEHLIPYSTSWLTKPFVYPSQAHEIYEVLKKKTNMFDMPRFYIPENDAVCFEYSAHMPSLEERTKIFNNRQDAFTDKKSCENIANIGRSLGYTVGITQNSNSTYSLNVLAPKTKAAFEAHEIISIEPVAPRDMTCFTVDAPDHLFLCQDYIVTHNTLSTLELLWELNPHYHVLIIGPKPVIRATWNDEIEKWKFPFRTKSLIVNDKNKKLKVDERHALYKSIQDMPHPAIWLINREMVCDLVDHLPKKNGKCIWPFKMVILDEAQSFKSYKSKRFKALRSVSPQIHRLIELTGTPTPNGLEDLWPLIYLIDQGQRLGTSISAYRANFLMPTKRTPQGVPIGWIPLPGSDKIIHQLVSDITVSLPDIITKMPAVTYDNRMVQLSDNERKLYKKLVKDSVLEFTNGDEVVAANAAVLQAKLSQLASGALYVNHTTEYQEIHRRKIDETLHIIDNAGSPVLVAYHFKSDKEMLVKYLREVLDPPTLPKNMPFNDKRSAVQVYDGSPDMVHRWNNGEIQVMLVQPASAGHGLNLQDGGHTLVWYTLPWSLEHYLQTNGRLHRQGQKYPVIIHRIMVEKTVDTQILSALTKKDLSEKALLQAVQLTIDEAEET